MRIAATPPTPAQEQLEAGMRWEDPPPRRNGAAVSLPWESWARMLRRNPERWARLRDYERPAGAANTRDSPLRRRYLPKERYEVRAVRTETSSILYARYIGDEDGGP